MYLVFPFYIFLLNWNVEYFWARVKRTPQITLPVRYFFVERPLFILLALVSLDFNLGISLSFFSIPISLSLFLFQYTPSSQCIYFSYSVCHLKLNTLT